MPDKLYSTEHLDAYLRGKYIYHSPDGDVEHNLQYMDGIIGVPIFVEGGEMIGFERYDLSDILKMDQETNQKKLLDFARNNDKKAILQMLAAEQEFYAKIRSEFDDYTHKADEYPNATVLSKVYRQIQTWTEALIFRAENYSAVPLPLIEQVMREAIKSKDRDLVAQLLSVPLVLDYFNQNQYEILSSAGDTSYQVAEYLIRVHEIYLREQIRLWPINQDSQRLDRYQILLEAAAKAENKELVRFLLAKLKAPNFSIDYYSLLQESSHSSELLLMLLNFEVFADLIREPACNDIVDRILEINNKELMNRLKDLGIFDDRDELKSRLITSASSCNIAALNIILSPERSEALQHLWAEDLESVLSGAVRSRSHEAIHMILQNEHFEQQIYYLYCIYPETLSKILNTVEWSRDDNSISTITALMLDQILCKFVLQSVLNDLQQKLTDELEPRVARIDFSSLYHKENNLLYCYLREPVMFETFISSMQFYNVMPVVVQQCMDIYRASLGPEFKFQDITLENINANLTMFLTFVSRSTPENLPDYAKMFAEQLLPHLVEHKGEYFNIIPFTEENFATMLKYLSAEDMQKVIGLTDHSIHHAWLLNVLLNHIDFANENSIVMLQKIAHIMQKNLTDQALNILIKFMEQGNDVGLLLLSMDQVEGLQGISTTLSLDLMFALEDKSSVFSLMKHKISENNFNDHIKELNQDLDINLSILKFMVEMTTHLNSIYAQVLGVGDHHKNWGDVALRLHDVKTLEPEKLNEDQVRLVEDLIIVNSKLDKLQNYLLSLSSVFDKHKTKLPDGLFELQEASLHPKQKYPGIGALRY